MLKTIKKLHTWGNSFGIRLSKAEIEKEEIKPNDEIEVLVIRKSSPARELFGTLKGKTKKPTDKIMQEIDKAFESRFD